MFPPSNLCSEIGKYVDMCTCCISLNPGISGIHPFWKYYDQICTFYNTVNKVTHFYVLHIFRAHSLLMTHTILILSLNSQNRTTLYNFIRRERVSMRSVYAMLATIVHKTPVMNFVLDLCCPTWRAISSIQKSKFVQQNNFIELIVYLIQIQLRTKFHIHFPNYRIPSRLRLEGMC